MKKSILLTAAILFSFRVCADTIQVATFKYYGPIPVTKPYMTDSVNIENKAFDMKSMLDVPMSLEMADEGRETAVLPECREDAIHLISFGVENSTYAKPVISISGLADYRLYVDGSRQSAGELKLEPATHSIVIKYLTNAESSDSLKISISDERNRVSLCDGSSRIFSLDCNTQGSSCGGVSISPSGRYIAVVHTMTSASGKESSYTEIMEASSGRIVRRTDERVSWMPSSDAYYFTRPDIGGRNLICTDIATQQEKVLAENLPEGYFYISPTEDCLFFTLTQEGPEEGEVHQILVPDDRQPGWRDRRYIARYDLKTRVMQPLTYGWHDAMLMDLSDDGGSMLFMTDTYKLTERPTQRFSLYVMNLETLAVDSIVNEDGFITNASFSPDGKQVLIIGSPECLNGVGNTLDEGMIPNQFDYQMYVMDIADRSVTPLTRDFAPSVESAEWSRYDGRIYFYASDKDCINMFRANPADGRIERLPNREEYIKGIALARTSPTLVYYGQSLSNLYRAYSMDTKKLRQTVLYDFTQDGFGDVCMGEGGAYEFLSSRGDSINCFYVLPPRFNPEEKYPLIVHYYGGCNPSTRYCKGSYSPQWYAAQGYVFLVINPSGASGFGQEFASRHVNTAGEGVAEDIIEAVQRFCQDHPFVNDSRIGCFSASYGGFMTQLLLTETDMFATGISHAGISSHTSYWGEGYWGYSYSETSMADSYPWNRKDLYVDRSTIYNADKIHTPLLFLHGSADTNVPIGESIQMFTALKLLGQETAFVVVDGENHGISEYGKKRQWLRTISAWFSKYLKDDDTWWNDLYPHKNL